MFNRFTLKDRARFMKKLSFLLSSGISFMESLSFIAEREDRVWKKEYYMQLIRRIRGGMSLHKGFDVKPLLIDARSLHVFKNGEMTGTLLKSCAGLSDMLEKKLVNRNRVIGSLIYPACILLFAFVLILLLLLVVFPKIVPLLASTGAELPFTTQMIIGISNLIEKYSLLLLSAVLGIGVALFYIVQKNVLRIPMLSRIVKLSKLSAITSSLSLFLETGFTLVESLSTISSHERNSSYKNALEEITTHLKKGGSFSKVLQKYPSLFSTEAVQFACIGEESGSLSKTLGHLATFYQEELAEIEKTTLSLMEPALMLIIGGVVGFVALSLISPIYSITSSMQS